MFNMLNNKHITFYSLLLFLWMKCFSNLDTDKWPTTNRQNRQYNKYVSYVPVAKFNYAFDKTAR